MGTNSTKKFIKNQAGTLAEEHAVTTSAGAGDSDKIPALNANGFLDPTIINSVLSSAGSGDSGKVVALDATGRIDATMMPVGFGDEVAKVLTSEALAAGDFVNVYNNAGTANVRKADATTSGKECHGFVLSAFASGVLADVYFDGTNTAVTGATPGTVFLSTTAGGSTSTAPSVAGNLVQRIGICISATSIDFEAQPPVILA